MRLKKLLIILGSVLISVTCGAQNVSGQDALFRGKLSDRYSSNFNGTPYWDAEGFLPGSIVYNGKTYDGVYINVDASLCEVNVKPSPEVAATSPDRNQVSWFTRGGHRFVNLRYLGIEGAREGFYEVLYDGNAALLKRVDKYLHKDTGNHNSEGLIGYEDSNYQHDVLSFFKISTGYFYLKDGNLTGLKNRNALLNIYKSSKRDLKSRMASAGLKGRGISDDVWFAGVMGLAEPTEGESGPLEEAARQWNPSSGSEIHKETPSVFAPVVKQEGRPELPEGYFQEKVSSSAEDLSDASVEALYQNKIYKIGDASKGQRKNARISGTVRDAATGKPMPDVTVWDDVTSTYTRTDARGRYYLNIPCGSNVINFSEMTRQELNLKVEIYGSGGLDVSMSEKVTQLNSAMISAESRMNHMMAKMGLERVSMKTISRIPSAFGEGDILKAVMALPGVKTVGEASGGFNVRGGASDQNLILFNEGTIYNPSHMFGLFSAFNPDVVDGVELYKSSIPVEYGGRISSVLNVRGKEGDPQKVKGSLGLGLLTSRFHLEGPLSKGKTTFVLGGRTTYSDWLLGRLPKSNSYADGKADFSDVNLGITHKADSLNTIQLFGYFSRDKFSFNQDTTFRYNNINAALRWRHKGRGNTSFVASAGYDRYGNMLDNFETSTEAYRLNTEIHQIFGRLKFETLAGKHTWSYGAEVIGYSLQGGHMAPYDENSLVIDRQLETEYAIQPSVYLGDTWRVDDKFSLEYGGRLSSFLAMDPSKFYFGPEFRFSAKYSFTPNLSVKAGANSLRQYIHLISNTSSISPMDTWKLCDADIKPVTGWQGAGGLYWTVFDGRLDLSAEAYWKNTWNYLDYKSGALLVMNENLSDDLVRTKGKAYGVEFMARKTIGKLNGWLSYTYSRTFLKEMEDRGASTINGGDWYKTAFDKPHDFKMVANYALTARFSLSANVDYSTGRPVTVPVGWFRYGGGYRLAYSERNGYRVPDYFRLDLALNIDPGHYLKKLTHMSVTLGCYNVTGRKNAYSVFYTTNGGRNIQGYKVSVFATQIPYINLNLLF